MRELQVPLESELAQTLLNLPVEEMGDLWIVLKTPGIARKTHFRAQFSKYRVVNGGSMEIEFRSFSDVVEDWAVAQGI